MMLKHIKDDNNYYCTKKSSPLFEEYFIRNVQSFVIIFMYID